MNGRCPQSGSGRSIVHELRKLDGTEGVSNTLQWSPDSKALAFFTGGTFKRINVDGGPAVTILAGAVANLGASWGRDDTP
jgi:hypothetical protein